MDAQEFWDSVEKKPEGCWEWKRGRYAQGYGQVFFDGKTTGAHRVAFALAKGSIPAGLHILHSCDNPPCCNPDHLRAGTHRDNADDKIARGRCRNRLGKGKGDVVRVDPEDQRAAQKAVAEWRDKIGSRLTMGDIFRAGIRHFQKVLREEA
jgi:hypothetical protein